MILRAGLIAALLAMGPACLQSALAQEKKYLGSHSCAGDCHSKIVESWNSGKHAGAFKNLAPGEREKGKKEAGLKPKTDYRSDKSCIPCHVTGWQDGGFSLENPDPLLMGVGCESCHGPAGSWNEAHQNKDLPNRERTLKQKGQRKPLAGRIVCVQCHEEESSPYKFRSPPGTTDWTEKKHSSSYHILK